MNADVVFGILLVRNKRLDQEISQNAVDSLNPLSLLCSLGNPFPCHAPGLVKSQQAALASSLNQLVGLCNKLGTGGLEPWVFHLSLVQDGVDILVVGEVQ